MVNFSQQIHGQFFKGKKQYIYIQSGVVTNQHKHYNYNRVPGAAGGGRKKRFQQSATTNSGAGSKETLNINAAGKRKKIIIK